MSERIARCNMPLKGGGAGEPWCRIYTTCLKRRSVINSGAIMPTTAKIESYEKHVPRISDQDEWEPTCTRVRIPSMDE
jgi:hypothetical protein